MTVTVDAATENIRVDIGADPHTFSHAAAASGIKGVVFIAIHGNTSNQHISGVTYGGVALGSVVSVADSAGEPGRSEIWFLGTGVPQDDQTVSIAGLGGTANDYQFTVVTLLADKDTEVIDFDSLVDNAADPSVTLNYGGRSAMAFAGLYSGHDAAPTSFTENGNCTRLHDNDAGAFGQISFRQTTAGTSDFAIGGTATSDDVALAAIAVAEVDNVVGDGLIKGILLKRPSLV